MCLQFDILASDLVSTPGRLTMFLNLGSKEEPDVTRRKRYWTIWTKANGGPPQRKDRLSPRIFVKRMALVEVADTTKNVRQEPVDGISSYSVIRDVIKWKTGQRVPPEPSVDERVVAWPGPGRGSST